MSDIAQAWILVFFFIFIAALSVHLIFKFTDKPKTSSSHKVVYNDEEFEFDSDVQVINRFYLVDARVEEFSQQRTYRYRKQCIKILYDAGFTPSDIEKYVNPRDNVISFLFDTHALSIKEGIDHKDSIYIKERKFLEYLEAGKIYTLSPKFIGRIKR